MTFKNIAFLSFIPDTGHIMPLLRIAYTLKEYKYNVICYFPEECRNLSNNFKIPFKSLGRVSEIVDDDDTEEISTAVNTAKQKFNEVAKKIRKGEIDDVIDELDEEEEFQKLLMMMFL